jgi:hypothetical protein
MIGARRLTAVALVLTLGACSKKAAEPNSGEAGTPASSAASVAASSSAMPSADPNAPKVDDTLFGRLADEAKNRPSIKPNADDVYAALDKAGFPVNDRKQSLGTTYKSSYCTGGYTKDQSLAVNVCEYKDDAAAKTGLDYAKTLFPGMANRSVYGHKSTLLTIINQKADPAADVRAKKIVAIYNGL